MPYSRTASPWAVILIKFQDDPAADPDRTIYQKLFTTAGNGTDNMLAFFEDMSHGQLDLSGSRVFGWYTLNRPRSDYVGNVYPSPVGKINRDGLLDQARAAATAAGVDLSQFAGVVVSAYGSTDLCGWIGGMAAICDQHSLQPSLLGQEMGHGYGLDHARRNGSAEDYQDPWDIMSTAGWPWMEEPNADYTDIGPGLNAQCMRSRGWLNESRVWRGSGAYDATVTLRPLHRRDLSGYLAAELGSFLVELRVPERWDAGIDEAVVLVHRFEDNHSYLMAADSGELQLLPGDSFTVGRIDSPFSDYLQVQVTALDPQRRTATLQLSSRPARPLVRRYLEAQIILGGVEVDGGGAVILPGGKIIPVPPRDPYQQLLSLVARYAGSEIGSNVALDLAQRRAVLEGIVETAQAELAENDLVSTSPTRLKSGPEKAFR